MSNLKYYFCTVKSQLYIFFVIKYTLLTSILYPNQNIQVCSRSTRAVLKVVLEIIGHWHFYHTVLYLLYDGFLKP